jgi:hypothetical protein
MNIIAIDPGPEQSGIVYMVDGKLKGASIEANSAIIHILEANCALRKRVYTKAKPYVHLAIEMPQSRGNIIPQSVLDTCVWVGRFRQVAGIPSTPIFPATIRTWLCGKPAVTKAAIKSALKDHYGEVGTEKNPGPLFGIKASEDHKWYALAVGTAWYMMQECEHEQGR